MRAHTLPRHFLPATPVSDDISLPPRYSSTPAVPKPQNLTSGAVTTQTFLPDVTERFGPGPPSCSAHTVSLVQGGAEGRLRHLPTAIALGVHGKVSFDISRGHVRDRPEKTAARCGLSFPQIRDLLSAVEILSRL